MQAQERKVKGSLLVDYVKMIKANKDKDWNKYLKPEDWELVNGRILPSVWYSWETFKRLGLATFHVLAGGKLELVEAWGKISMDLLLKGIYRSILADADPVIALERFAIMRNQFFNFASFEIKKYDAKHLLFSYKYDPNEPEGYEAYNAQLLGMLEHLIEMAGGKNPKVAITSKEWKGDPQTEFDMRWQ